jgi:hypothetical protein
MLDEYMINESEKQGKHPVTGELRPQTSAKMLKTWQKSIDSRLVSYDLWMGGRRYAADIFQTSVSPRQTSVQEQAWFVPPSEMEREHVPRSNV